jgi:hypothetical protein
MSKNILSPETYGFKLIKNDDGLKTFSVIVNSLETVELVQLENVFSLNYFFKDEKTIVANRYKCNSQADLEFLLFNGRVGSIFTTINNR